MAIKSLIEELPSEASWDKFCLMVYGVPGVGKTWLAGTAIDVEELLPVLIIDNDGGSQTIRGKEQFAGLTIWRIKEFIAYNEVYTRLAANPCPFRTVVVDNLGAVHEMAIGEEMKRVVKRDVTREEYVPSMREYGIVRKQILKMMTYFQTLPINLIVTAHADLSKDEVLQTTRIRPSLPGKLAHEVAGMSNIVLYLDVEKSMPMLKRAGQKGNANAPKKTLSRIAYAQPTGRIDAKDQSDSLGETIYDPTMLKIYQTINR